MLTLGDCTGQSMLGGSSGNNNNQQSGNNQGGLEGDAENAAEQYAKKQF